MKVRSVQEGGARKQRADVGWCDSMAEASGGGGRLRKKVRSLKQRLCFGGGQDWMCCSPEG